MPWWGWGIVGLVTVVLGLFALRKQFRRWARRRLIEHLRQTSPETQLLEEHDDRLVLKTGDGTTGPLFLDRFYKAMAGATAPEAERVVLDHWTALVQEGRELVGRLSKAEHGPRILPRLVPLGFFDQIEAEAKIPRRPLDDTGLFVVYVLDSPSSVAYLTDDHVKDLLVGPDELHRLALQNLRGRTPPDLLARALAPEGVVQVGVGDSYDAARLLLLSDQLAEGKALAAAIPDRDTLLVAPLPKDGDWGPLRKLARAPRTDRPLVDRPLRVTREGCELA